MGQIHPLLVATQEVIAPIASIFDKYDHDAADINEALDTGIASCAVRSYAAGLLIKNKFDNPNLYIVEYGIAPEHGDEFKGNRGTYNQMDHAVARLSFPAELPPLIVDSYKNRQLEVVAPNDDHEDLEWYDLNEGYAEYLDRAGLDYIELDPDEVLRFLVVGTRAASNPVEQGGQAA